MQMDLANCALNKEEVKEESNSSKIDTTRIPDWYAGAADLPEPKQKLSSLSTVTPSFTTMNSPIRRMLQISNIPK